MKNLFLCFIVVAAISCNSSKEKPDMPGAYLMQSQTINDGQKDTKYTSLQQLKIYTDSFMMYAQINPSDSVSAFGVASYTPTDSGTVIETAIYTSRDSSATTAQSSFNVRIQQNPDGYTQVIPQFAMQGQNMKLTEEYKSVGTKATSPLDGVWKETKSFIVKGNDTTYNNRTQYKAFYSGYFMFGSTVKDSTSKTTTGIGFGTFQMAGNNKVKETDLNSSYAIIAGNSFDIDVDMSGPDSYNQTITDSTGSKSVEFYERLKK
ncbi:MAG: hypothetical protein ACRDE8_12920 [Ginsengibacter sp.]